MTISIFSTFLTKKLISINAFKGGCPPPGVIKGGFSKIKILEMQ